MAEPGSGPISKPGPPFREEEHAAKNLPQSTHQRPGEEASGRGQGYGPISQFHDEMERLFDRFFGGLSWLSWRGDGGFLTASGDARVPEIDVSENDKEYCVEADLPGLDEKDISLMHENGVLTLKAEKREACSPCTCRSRRRLTNPRRRSKSSPADQDLSRSM